ncbi:unnamed protein product [Diabrotica balteata]|uniref:Uncharacterized protein n=1 Tax=Diabrotica balteata TaxID=107213 RepID=A0A9N9T547_DIABA|nr:unnamed protein product [Diabrotica balteata]
MGKLSTQNVVQLLINSFSLKPNGVWTSEAADVFKSNKTALQMEVIEYQEDSALKEVYTEVLESRNACMWIKYVCDKKYPELKSLAMKL